MATKPQLDDSFVWAAGADPVRDIIIPVEQLAQGWNYADKPAYQYFNWYWNQVTGFLVHINQNGIPVWDDKTAYFSSGYAKEGSDVYQAFSYNYGLKPSENTRIWKPQEYVAGLKDVSVDDLKDNDLLVNYKGAWVNMSPKEAIRNGTDEFFLHEVANLKYEPGTPSESDIYPDSTIYASKEQPTQVDSFKTETLSNILKNKVKLKDCADVKLNLPQTNDILTYKEVTIIDPNDDNKEHIEMRWVNSPYVGRVNWYNISNKPDFYNPILGSRTQYGGAKMWLNDETIPDPSLLIQIDETRELTSAPSNFRASKDQNGKITVEFNGIAGVNNYKLYVDNGSTEIVDIGPGTKSDYFPPDNVYHTLYVRGENTNTGEISYASNYDLGISLA